MKWTDADIELLKSLRASGFSAREIAARIPGATRWSVRGMSLRLGMKYDNHGGTVGIAQARAKCKMPNWVPPELIHEWADHAESFGEIAAAAYIRDLKRNARAASKVRDEEIAHAYTPRKWRAARLPATPQLPRNVTAYLMGDRSAGPSSARVMRGERSADR